MSDAKIRVIVKRPDERYGHVTHMSNTLSAFQKAVDGPIETVREEIMERGMNHHGISAGTLKDR